MGIRWGSGMIAIEGLQDITSPYSGISGGNTWESWEHRVFFLSPAHAEASEHSDPGHAKMEKTKSNHYGEGWGWETTAVVFFFGDFEAMRLANHPLPRGKDPCSHCCSRFLQRSLPSCRNEAWGVTQGRDGQLCWAAFVDPSGWPRDPYLVLLDAFVVFGTIQTHPLKHTDFGLNVQLEKACRINEAKQSRTHPKDAWERWELQRRWL